MTEQELKLRTKKFAHRCIKLALALNKDELSNHKKKQLIRCSSSVAANYRATCLAQSKSSFAAKISIVVEEVDESNFWLEFIIDEGLMIKELVEPLQKESAELTSIFVTSRKTIQTRNKK